MENNELNQSILNAREARDEAAVISAVNHFGKLIGAKQIFMSGLPMPGRPLEMLVLHLGWPGLQNDSTGMLEVATDDPLLELALVLRSPFVISPGQEHYDDVKSSRFCADINGGYDTCLVVVPFQALNPYQGVMVFGGLDHIKSGAELCLLDDLANAAFVRLSELRVFSPERPGALSPRERRVIELTAYGKTASEIAKILQISHRTVHAHLQNASSKLDARNKTQTVVEAIRYGQMSLAYPQNASSTENRVVRL